MDEDHLYYLQSRGLTKKQAMQLITYGYLKPVVEEGYVYSNATTLGVVESVGEALDLAKDHYEYLVREDAEAACLVDIDSEEGQEEIKYYIEKHLNGANPVLGNNLILKKFLLYLKSKTKLSK